MNKQRKTSNILNVFQYDESTGAVTLPSTLDLTAPGSSDDSTKAPTTAWVRALISSLGYVTLSTDQTITGLKTIVRSGDVLNFKIGTDTLYGLKVAYNQNELVESGEATWSFANTFNNGIGTGITTTPISFFRGVLVTGQRLLSASVNANLLDYYGNNPSGRYPVYAYNTGVQQFASGVIVGDTAGVVNAATGAIADLPAGVVANFKGRVIGSNAVNNNEFVTLSQLTTASGAYLPLSGGTLTGPLNGTSATFSGTGYFGGATSASGLTGAAELIVQNEIGIQNSDTTGPYLRMVMGGLNQNITFVTGAFSGTEPNLLFSVGGSTRLTLFSTGAATFSSSVTANTLLTVNTPASGSGVVFRHVSGTNNPGLFIETVESSRNVRLTASGSSVSGQLLQLGAEGNAGVLNIGGTNVGIGTPSPNRRLEVVTTSEQLRLAYDTSGSVYTDFRNDSAGGLLVNTSNSYIIHYIAGSPIMRMNANGNVGIGASSLLERLSVSGNIHVEGTGNSIYFDTSGSGRAIRQYVDNLYDFHITNGRGTSSRFILGSNVISLGTTSTPQFSMTLSTAAALFTGGVTASSLTSNGSISASGTISGATIIGSLFQSTVSYVSGVGTSFVSSGTSFGNDTGIWLVSVTGSGDGNMYSAVLYIVTTAAYSKTINLVAGPSNHFGNGSLVAGLSTTDGVSADLLVRRTTSGTASVQVRTMRIA